MRQIGLIILVIWLFACGSCYRMGSLGDSYGEPDSDTDSDVDGDVDTDSDSDTDSDTETVTVDEAPACVADFGGQCRALVPFGMDNYICPDCYVLGNNWTINEDTAGCEEDEWCCVPAAAPSNQCEAMGGLCIQGDGEAECPPCFGVVNMVGCDDGDECCMSGVVPFGGNG